MATRRDRRANLGDAVVFSNRISWELALRRGCCDRYRTLAGVGEKAPAELRCVRLPQGRGAFVCSTAAEPPSGAESGSGGWHSSGSRNRRNSRLGGTMASAPHPGRTGSRCCCSGSPVHSCSGSTRGRSSDCCSRSRPATRSDLAPFHERDLAEQLLTQLPGVPVLRVTDPRVNSWLDLIPADSTFSERPLHHPHAAAKTDDILPDQAPVAGEDSPAEKCDAV